MILAKSIRSFFSVRSKRNKSIWYFFLQQYLLHKCPLGIFSWRARFISTTSTHIAPHQTKNTKQMTASAVHASTPGNHRRGCSPAADPPTMLTTKARDDRAEVLDQAASRSREQQGTVFCAPSPALDSGDDDDANWAARGLTSSGL